MLTFDFNPKALTAQIDALKTKAEAAIRPAAQAGAQVFYDEMKKRVPMSAKPHKSGKKTYNPGTLRKAIYQAYAEDESGDGRATYRVSWNKTHAFYGRFIEFGTSKAPAQPFLRPAYDAARNKAIQAAQSRLSIELKKVTK
jgi:HK97 gp10 family phage protein